MNISAWKRKLFCMCAFNTSRLSKIGNLLSLNFYILEASQKRPDVLQDEESVLQKKMKSSKSTLFFTPTNQRRHKSDTAVDHFKPGQGAKKIIFTACHSGKLTLAFTSPDVISTSPKSFSSSRIDFTLLLLFEFLKEHHLPVGQVKNRFH